MIHAFLDITTFIHRLKYEHQHYFLNLIEVSGNISQQFFYNVFVSIYVDRVFLLSEFQHAY